MSDPVSLRNIPSDTLKLAHALSMQTGLSLSDVFRLALTSGVLIEATKVAPTKDGTLAGWDGQALAQALRRHLGSAIDLLIQHGEHPYGRDYTSSQPQLYQRTRSDSLALEEPAQILESDLADDLDALGVSFSLSDALEDDR